MSSRADLGWPVHSVRGVIIGWVIVDQDVVLGVFSDQAHNLILLAEDEARMLGQPEVDPEHLLLALARSGNVESLLARRRIKASDIYRAVVDAGGRTDKLVLGRVPHSAATNAALARAIERGGFSPSSEHVLLGLRDAPAVIAIMHDVGIDDIDALVHEVYSDDREPLSSDAVDKYLARVGHREPPRPGPIPPVFERFTDQARTAIIAAQRGDSNYAEPVDLLRGLLTVEDGVAARVLTRHGITRSAVEASEPRPSAQQAVHGPWAVGSNTPIAPSARSVSHQPEARLEAGQPRLGQLYGDATRRLIAEESLKQAFQHGQKRIGTGHLLLAILETKDHAASAILVDQDPDSLRAGVIDALPGDET